MAELKVNEAGVNEDSMEGRFLTFVVENELFGIEIRYVTEIVSLPEIIEMPEMPDYIKGIINLRGKIIPLMCVRTRFLKEKQDYDDRTCVIVVDFEGMLTGLIVDSVSEVLTLLDENIEEAPQSSLGIDNSYVDYIGKTDSGVVMLLNFKKLLMGMPKE